MVKHVVIVGGGLAGLACAVSLGDAGLRVTLVEREKRLGGRARSWTDSVSGDTIDLGPHVLHSEYANMLAFLERLGTRHLVRWQPEKLVTIVSPGRTAVLRALDAMDALEYLRPAGVTGPMIDWFWAFAALSVMNVPLERCSTAALLRVHSQMIGHRHVHSAFRRSGSRSSLRSSRSTPSRETAAESCWASR